MQCKCGYNFNEHALDESRPYNSYAVIHDKDYPRFMKWEVRSAKSRTKKNKLAALAHSAQYVGSLQECPICLRLMLYRRDEDDMPMEILVREE